jgi:hypothetical protein
LGGIEHVNRAHAVLTSLFHFSPLLLRGEQRHVGGGHLESWLVEMSADGKSWLEVAREENNEQLDGAVFSGTFAVAGGGECRFIRPVNIGRNHYGNDILSISAWEIFGSLIE